MATDVLSCVTHLVYGNFSVLCSFTGGFHYDNHLFYVVCVHDGNRSTIAILECYRSHSRIQSVHMVPALGEANLDGVGTTIFATFLFPIFLN